MGRKSPTPSFAVRQSGSITSVLLTMLLLAVVSAGAFALIRSGNPSPTGDEPLMATVSRGPYEHIVLEQGEVESSNNVEIKCQVKNRTGGDSPATTIIDLIPEGTPVKAGDWLITFDSSALENEMTQQTIVAKNAETLVIQAKAAYDTAVMARTEYLEGTFEQERKTNQNLIFVAEENLKKAELSYGSIKRSVARGLISPLQLEGERFRVEAAKKELELARQNLDVLENYTKKKMVTQLASAVESTKIQWENMEISYKEELKSLEQMQQQLLQCRVTAPQDGQVVYANVYSSRSSNEFVVEAGAAVRERQTIIRLPDPRNMQINAKINESQITQVCVGMRATVRVDAVGGQTLEGEVTKVNKYAEPGNWWSSSGKEYQTLIKIDDPPKQLRTGLSAEVRIHVEDLSDALQIPVQAVFEKQGQTFCLVGNGKSYETRKIVFRSTNDKTVAIDEESSDLREGESVVLNPREHTEKFDFSNFPDIATDTSDESSDGGSVDRAAPRDDSRLDRRPDATQKREKEQPATAPAGRASPRNDS